MRTRLLVLAVVVGLVASSTAQERERLDYETIGKIREEGLLRSQVMDHLSWLADVYGPRVSGTPAYRQAAEWAVKTLTSWGLANAHLEYFPFAKGWSIVRFTAHMIEPQIQPLIGFPRAWTPGTSGTITAEVVQAVIASEADFEKFRGKLRGKLVLSQPAREVKMLEGRVAQRWTEGELAEAERLPIPPPDPNRPQPAPSGPSFQQRTWQFYKNEGVLAIIDRGEDITTRADGGTVFGFRGLRPWEDPSITPPQIAIAVEHYNRMARILGKGLPVRVELNAQVQWHDEGELDGINVIGEIPGTDLAHEVVMLGAHFDSTHAGTGATDNGCGSAAMMEALRILKAVGARPRRTIRLGLWGSEENGHLGSIFHAREQYGDARTLALKPAHRNFSVYFNIDNGSGRLRGVWLQGVLGAAPIFRQWMEPLADLGMTTLSTRSVGGTDHQSFDVLGLPGFQFIQDRLEYNTRTHHSNMDVVDRVQAQDMMQMSTVAAVFAYNAAMRDEKMPRKALPGPAAPPSQAAGR